MGSIRRDCRGIEPLEVNLHGLATN
jgi:hypothetical protein